MSRALAAVALCCVLFAVPGAAAAQDPAATLPARPNIVMFYIDDVSPHDARLWNDPARTPNIYNHFIARGVEFTNSVGENPLCCPARGNLLTGLHTHNNGVVDNNAKYFDPSEHIGKALGDAGYASFFLGKYLNRNNELTAAQWDQHDAGWTQLDVLKGINGSFFGYTLHTKTSDFRVSGLHSTQMVGDRMVMHLRETPSAQPVFAVLSIYNLHAPNTPMPGDVGDPRCAGIPPWNPPNYNEADVSDKPTAIRNLPLQPHAGGWPMVRYCEEMLGVDRVVGQVTAELEAQGRLDNTLLVFTGDNGIAWGAHRLGQNKTWPYTTPVPLYMSWPAAGWGTTHTQLDEVVSNIDLAPTFCELAGNCVLGPFRHSIDGPDGESLVPLLDGTQTALARDAVLEASYIKGSSSWTGLRTTEAFHPDQRWHYVEYLSGERELYDLVADPWELDNRAYDPAYSGIVAQLQSRLGQLRLEGINPGFGSVRIRVDSTPDRAADYWFGGEFGSFALDDDPTDATLPSERTWTGLSSGVYEINRPRVAPWIPTDIDCDGVHITEVSIGRLLVYVHPGENVTCTYMDAGPKPDGLIALTPGGPYKTDNLYQTTPSKKQTVKRLGVVPGTVYEYILRMQNDSRAPDSLTLTAAATGPATVSTSYFWGETDITAAVVGGTFSTGDLAPSLYVPIFVRVTIEPGTPTTPAYKLVLRVGSGTSPATFDAVRIVAKR